MIHLCRYDYFRDMLVELLEIMMQHQNIRRFPYLLLKGLNSCFNETILTLKLS